MREYVDQLRREWLNRDRELTGYIDSILKQLNRNGQLSLLEQQKQIFAHLFQKASAYTNLIIFAGYAGILGGWNLTREYIDKTIAVRIALLFFSSLFLFIVHEVWNMITGALFFRKLNRIILKAVPENERVAAWQLATNEFSLKQLRIWFFFLVPTALSGFGAGIIIIYQLIMNL